MDLFVNGKCRFVESCDVCRREDATGAAFRGALHRSYDDVDQVDFECKHGEKWIDVKPRGFGDTIAKLTSAVGIKPCGGCKKRQAALNKLIPYKE